jgi:hypothetical protein
MSHNSQWASTAARKVRELEKHIHTAEIQDEINNEKVAHKESLQRQKLLQEELNIAGLKT